MGDGRGPVHNQYRIAGNRTSIQSTSVRCDVIVLLTINVKPPDTGACAIKQSSTSESGRGEEAIDLYTQQTQRTDTQRLLRLLSLSLSREG